MSKLTTFLWFDGQAEDAAKFYVSLFKNAQLGEISRYGEGGPGTPGSAMTAAFEIEGQPFVALNGGPQYTFTEAVSFQIHCESQAEVDYFWEKLTDGGEEGQCGWLKDKFGLSWQVTPSAMTELLAAPDPEKASRVVQAMLQMKKIDLSVLQEAYAHA